MVPCFLRAAGFPIGAGMGSFCRGERLLAEIGYDGI